MCPCALCAVDGYNHTSTHVPSKPRWAWEHSTVYTLHHISTEIQFDSFYSPHFRHSRNVRSAHLLADMLSQILAYPHPWQTQHTTCTSTHTSHPSTYFIFMWCHHYLENICTRERDSPCAARETKRFKKFYGLAEVFNAWNHFKHRSAYITTEWDCEHRTWKHHQFVVRVFPPKFRFLCKNNIRAKMLAILKKDSLELHAWTIPLDINLTMIFFVRFKKDSVGGFSSSTCSVRRTIILCKMHIVRYMYSWMIYIVFGQM